MITRVIILLYEFGEWFCAPFVRLLNSSGVHIFCLQWLSCYFICSFLLHPRLLMHVWRQFYTYFAILLRLVSHTFIHTVFFLHWISKRMDIIAFNASQPPINWRRNEIVWHTRVISSALKEFKSHRRATHIEYTMLLSLLVIFFMTTKTLPFLYQKKHVIWKYIVTQNDIDST